MSKRSTPPAVILNWLLYAIIALLVAGLGAGAYFMQKQLSGYVRDVNHLKIDSELNEQDIQQATRLEKALSDHKEDVERAAAIVADTTYYQYQNQIVQDITSYGSTAGIEVLGFDFAAKSTAQPINGVKSVVATVSLKSPISYPNYLRFLKLIERNLTKMQVSKLDITLPLENPGFVNSSSMTVEVYVR